MTPEKKCVVTIVVSGPGADTLAKGFIEMIRQNNRSKKCTDEGCSYTALAYAADGARIELCEAGHNGLAAATDHGSVELY